MDVVGKQAVEYVKSGWICQVRRGWKYGRRIVGPETGRIETVGKFDFFYFLLWVEHAWSSGRVRRVGDDQNVE